MSILSAAEPERSFRLIEIICPDQRSTMSATSEAQAESYGARGQEYGMGQFFRSSQIETEAAATSATGREEKKNDQLTIEPILRNQLRCCYEQRGARSNPLLVQFRFKDDGNRYSPFAIHCGIFISGSDVQREAIDLTFDLDANTKMTQLKLSGTEIQAWDTIKQCLTSRREQGQTGKICCKYPHVQIAERHFCSGSLRDIYELAKEGGTLTPEEHQKFVRDNLGLSEENYQLRLNEIYGNPDCLVNDFTGNFYDSEQAWLKFVSSPIPPLKYVRFSGEHNAIQIREVEISLISYLDICRYCRGTLSVLLSQETDKRFFHHFLYRNLPAALLTRMKQKECSEEEFKKIFLNLQSLSQVCGFYSKIPRYIGELQKIREALLFLGKFKIESSLAEIQSITSISQKLKIMYDEIEGLVRSGFYDNSIGLVLRSIRGYSFQQIPSRRA